jgi:hypothetical protein
MNRTKPLHKLQIPSNESINIEIALVFLLKLFDGTKIKKYFINVANKNTKAERKKHSPQNIISSADFLPVAACI